MWTFIEGVWKVIEGAGNLIESLGTITEGARQVGSYVNIDDRIETLKRKCEDLRFRAEDVKTELGNAESSSGEKRRKTVENWLTNVQNLRNQVDATLSQSGILERPQLANKVQNLTELAEEFLEQGKFPQGLTLNTPHDGGVDLLTKPLVGQAFQDNLEKIWGYLMEPELLTIGIWGMGGVGKTTLVTHINNRARKQRDTFSDVCWVTISQNLDIHKLQQKLANAVCLKFDDEDEMERASMLYSELEKRRCLLILDDVWQDIDFHKVGIPVKVNCGKVIITFHIDRHVLRDMAINMKSIEIWGMGGVGKTTLVTHINNRARKQRGNIFGDVCWVTVSQNLDIHKLQDRLADAIGLKLNEQDERQRAARLSSELEKKRCLLILDDVWQGIDFHKVGIPVNANCKVIITTRLLDVCNRMDCHQTIKVEILSEEEAWDLFQKNLGRQVEALSEEVSEVASLVARECAGLPLGIITVAGCMREVNDVCEWRDALRALKDSKADGLEEMEDEVFRVLQFSYSRLNDPKVQQSFLYCALYPEDYKIERENLIQRLIDERVIEGMKSRQEQFDKGYTILNKLVNSCLLEIAITINENEKDYVKMHDLLRDMAIKMNPQFVVKAGKKIGILTGWSEDVERVSLMNCSIEKVAPGASLRSPKLSTLLLSSNHYLRRIEDSFFQHMPALEILDLTNCKCIQELPNSVSNLKNLIALVLFGCSDLKGVPSLAELELLKRLDLHGTGIIEVPEGLERLVNLMYLDLDAKGLKVFPAGILPQLLLLQFLTFDDGVEIKGEELRMQERLSTFKGKLIFDRPQCLKSYVTSRKPYKGTNCSYSFTLNGKGKSVCEEYSRVHNLINVRARCFNLMKNGRANVDVETLEAFLKDVQSLELDECYGARNLCDVSWLDNATNNLKRCQLDSCRGMKFLVPSSGSSPLFLRNLEKLELNKLGDLEVLFELGSGEDAIPSSLAASAVEGPFSCLTVLVLSYCHKIKMLLHPSFLPNLQNLQEIRGYMCGALQGIIGETNSEGETSKSIEYALPNLTILSLWSLRQLKSICAQTISCPSLSEITVVDCPQLKRMPLSLAPSSFKSISPKEYWLESAEWDHPNAKELLKPYIKW